MPWAGGQAVPWPAVPRPGVGRVATRIIAVVAVALAAGASAGCGTPSGLDHQEQVAFARACASLIERGLSNNHPPRTALLGSDEVNLDEPSAFYSILNRLRGPDTFDLHDPAHDSDTAREPLDNCNTRPKVLQSLFPTTTTSTTTPTTTTSVPGS